MTPGRDSREVRLVDIAPRLARAHAAELAYQQRKRDLRRRGVISMEIASEEMIRALRQMQSAFRTATRFQHDMQRIREAAVVTPGQVERLRAAIAKLGEPR